MMLKRLRDLREDKDKSQEEIAKILHTHRQTYGNYETGIRTLPLEHLIILCEYYGVSADYILGLPEGLPYGLSKTRGAVKN